MGRQLKREIAHKRGSLGTDNGGKWYVTVLAKLESLSADWFLACHDGRHGRAMLQASRLGLGGKTKSKYTVTGHTCYKTAQSLTDGKADHNSQTVPARQHQNR